MGNQVCCTSGPNEFEHFQQVHNYNRRNRGHSHHRDEVNNETKMNGQVPNPIKKDRGRAGAFIDNPDRSKSPNVYPPPNAKQDKEFKAMYKQMQDQKMKCLLVDKYSLDFSKPFNPPNKSALALAAMQNKNGCRISSKQFIAFQTGMSKENLPYSPKNLSVDIGLIKNQLEREHNFQISFLDFSQRRKVGFRGAFEFDTKRILIANESHIKILAYFQNLDGSQLLQTVQAKRERNCRSKSPAPITPQIPRRGQRGQLLSQNTIPALSQSRDLSAGVDIGQRHKQFWDTDESTSSRAHQEAKPASKQAKNAQPKQPKKEVDEQADSRLASFEIASFQLPDYPNEKINYVKFLDDNDPRLLFLVTYSTKLSTTYMKVIKIEKSKPLRSMSLASRRDTDVNAGGTSRANRQSSFSLLESQPFTELKKEIIDHQMNRHRQKQPGNPNAADSNQTGLYMANGGFRPHENLKAMLKPNAKKQCLKTADLQITSMGMTKPIKMKPDWDPQSNFEELVLKQIDEMERQEFQQDSDQRAPEEAIKSMQDGVKASNILGEEAQQQQEAAQDIIKERTAALRLGGIKKAPQSGVPLQYELIQSKLGKFKNTELKILYFGNAFTGQGANGGTTSRAKQMISVDQNRIYRVHKVKGIKMMADKDYLLSPDDFPDGEDPKKIQNLKGATYRQLKDVQLVAEYVFCSLLQSSRLNCLDPVQIQTSSGVNAKQIAYIEPSSPIPREVAVEDSKEGGQEQIKSDAETTAESPLGRNQEAKVQVEKVIFHQGVIIASLTIERLNQPSTFKQTVIKHFSMLSSESEAGAGRSLDLNSQYFAYNKKYMSSIDFLKIPRLDWDDRRIEYEIAADQSNGQDGVQSAAGKAASLQLSDAKNGAQATPRLPKKLIVSGKYKILPKKDNKNHDDSSTTLKAQREWPFVALVDTQLLEKRAGGAGQDFTMIKCFQYEVEGKAGFFKKGQEQQSKLNLEITALNYGPYDNGHIILGFNNGHILILNSLDLSSMFRLQVFEPLLSEISSPSPTKQKNQQQSNELDADKLGKSAEIKPQSQYLPISKIQFDPTQMILVSSEVPHSLPQEATIPTAAQQAHPGYARYNLAGITLIEKVTQYKYIDMGQDTFMTLVIPKDENKGGKPRNLSPTFEGAGLC